MNPAAKKTPQDEGMGDGTDHIAHDKLRAQHPPKVAKVAGMPKDRVHTSRDKDMTLLVFPLNRMVETRTSLSHGKRSQCLAHDHEEEADYHHGPLDTAVLQGGKEDAFQKRGEIGNVVSPSIRGEKEGGHESIGGVVSGRDVVFEEVEQTQSRHEEGNPPPPRGQKEDGQRRRDAEDGSKEECT